MSRPLALVALLSASLAFATGPLSVWKGQTKTVKLSVAERKASVDDGAAYCAVRRLAERASSRHVPAASAPSCRLVHAPGCVHRAPQPAPRVRPTSRWPPRYAPPELPDE